MLPSKGLFKADPCPLFEKGECDRPHCHFRHKKADANDFFDDYFASLEEAIDKIPIKLNWGPPEKEISKIVYYPEKDDLGNQQSKSSEEENVLHHEENKSGFISDTRDLNEVLEAEQAVRLNEESDVPESLDIHPPVFKSIKSPPDTIVEPVTSKVEPKRELITSVGNAHEENLAMKQEQSCDLQENSSSVKQLSKEQLRGIDDIVRLLKKVPERIDFVASFLKSLVHTEEKTKSSSSPSSSHRKSRSSSSHSSRANKSSSRSSRNSDRKHKNDRRSEKKEHSKSSGSRHTSDKRKRENNVSNGDVIPKKISRRESSEKPKQVQDSSPEDEGDSDIGFDTAFDSFEPAEVKEEVRDKNRLSLEEELERIHESQADDDKKPTFSKPSFGKQRIAHDTPYISDHKMLRAKVGKSTPISRPSDRIISALPDAAPTVDASRATSLFGLPGNKPRIVAVANAQRLLAAKSNLATSVNRLSIPTSTVAKTVAQGSKRIEHKTDNQDVLCPTVTSGSPTIPVNVRNLTLKRLYTALQYFPSKNEARDEALNIEVKVFNEHKDSSKKYHMSTVNAIMKAKRGFGKGKPSGPSELEFYERACNFLLTEEELVKNGFPTELEEEGYARCFLSDEFKYNKKYRYIKDAIAKGGRFCIRCSMTYKVDEETWEQTAIPDVCVFHSDNSKRRVLGEVTHKCCSTPGRGCMSESLHITDIKDYERLPNCVKSKSRAHPEKYRKVLALDCEMVHTRLGVELAYVVVVDSKCSVVYESYCKPFYEVECYNTAYSGITEEKLRNVTKTLTTVQEELLELISDETVLVGHSLDSDFRALHLVHKTVADTAYIFRVESPDGSFYKRRLKELAQTLLGKIIQESEYGHCAEEDAATAMSLLRHRVLSM